MTIAREIHNRQDEGGALGNLGVAYYPQESYQVGKTNLASAIQAQQADQQIRSGYVDAVTAYQNAYADLEKAVGTPLSF